jgi:hypothetical protein
MSLRAKLWMGAKIVILVGVAFTAFMGFAHTKAGRPILSWMGRAVRSTAAVCPLGYDRPASTQERALKRASLAQAHRGEPLARRRTALAFELGRTTRVQVENWVSAKSGSCKELKSKLDLECSGLFFSSLQSTLWLEFDGAGVLVSEKGIEKFATVADAALLYEELRANMKSENEKSVRETGSRKVADLERGLLNQASSSTELGNFSANARLTNMGQSFVVSQDFATF